MKTTDRTLVTCDFSPGPHPHSERCLDPRPWRGHPSTMPPPVMRSRQKPAALDAATAAVLIMMTATAGLGVLLFLVARGIRSLFR